jgi:hypothetical protein
MYVSKNAILDKSKELTMIKLKNKHTKTIEHFYHTCRLNEFNTDGSNVGNSEDTSLVTELVEEWRDLPPAQSTGGDNGASPCKFTDWNPPLFEGEF